VTEKKLLRHVLEKAPPQMQDSPAGLCTEIRMLLKHFCVCDRMLMTRSLSCLPASLRGLPWTKQERLMLKVEKLGALRRQILILQED